MNFNEHRKILKDLERFEGAISKAVVEMGSIGENYFKSSFKEQGFTDVVKEPWKPRKRERYRTRSGKVVNDATRAILVKSGALRRSLRAIKKGKYTVIVSSNVPYANIHNEGLMGKYSFKMPRRQFVGHSEKMSYKIERMIHRRIRSV